MAITWQNFLMAASIGGGVETQRSDGLIEGHAYSLISVREIGVEGGDSIQLVELRNPWGNHHEWNGAWSDHAPEWRSHREVARAVSFAPKADGLFWMSWADFSSIFTSVELCQKSMPVKRAGFGALLSGQKAIAASMRAGGWKGKGPIMGATGGKRIQKTEVNLRAEGRGFGTVVPSKGQHQSSPPRRLLPRAAMSLQYPNVAIQPPAAQPNSPYAQYLQAHKLYVQAYAAEAAAHASGTDGAE